MLIKEGVYLLMTEEFFRYENVHKRRKQKSVWGQTASNTMRGDWRAPHPLLLLPPHLALFFLKDELVYLYIYFFFFWGGVILGPYMTHGSSQARGPIGAIAAGLHHSSWQCQILNPLSEARPRIEPASSWILVRFVFSESRWKLPSLPYL